MTCPKCGYNLAPFDTSCPRCARPTRAQSPPPVPIPPQAPSPFEVPPSTASPTSQMVSSDPPGADGRMQFQVMGDVMEAVVVQMQQGDELRAEAGAMLFMTAGIQMDTRMEGGLFGGLKRMLVGESLFIPTFRCLTPTGVVAFASPNPGKVRRLDLNLDAWLCQSDSFLFCTRNLEINIAFTKKLSVGFFGGEGFILQRLSGLGTAFISGGGNFVEFDLKPNEIIKVDTGCIVAFQESVHYDIEFVGGFRNTLFGGEGLFLATLRGPGKAILQTLPFSRLAGRIVGTSSEGSSGIGGIMGTARDIGRIFGKND